MRLDQHRVGTGFATLRRVAEGTPMSAPVGVGKRREKSHDENRQSNQETK